jgi:hypothetical protein
VIDLFCFVGERVLDVVEAEGYSLNEIPVASCVEKMKEGDSELPDAVVLHLLASMMATSSDDSDSVVTQTSGISITAAPYSSTELPKAASLTLDPSKVKLFHGVRLSIALSCVICVRCRCIGSWLIVSWPLTPCISGGNAIMLQP